MGLTLFINFTLYLSIPGNFEANLHFGVWTILNSWTLFLVKVRKVLIAIKTLILKCFLFLVGQISKPSGILDPNPPLEPLGSLKIFHLYFTPPFRVLCCITPSLSYVCQLTESCWVISGDFGHDDGELRNVQQF
jgi:hypothetical protein